MRTIHTDVITDNIKEMCIEANLKLSDAVSGSIRSAVDKEKSTGERGSCSSFARTWISHRRSLSPYVRIQEWPSYS